MLTDDKLLAKVQELRELTITDPTKPFGSKEQSIERIHREMTETTQEPEPSMTHCVFEGNPPNGYVTWNEWYNELGSKGILHNLKISSIDYKQSPQEPEELMEKLGFVKDSDGNWTGAQPLVETE